MRARKVFCVLMGLLLAGALGSATTALYGQVDRGAITGTVHDPTGAVVPGATVAVTQTETKQSVTLTTDNSGSYTANLLRVGTYSVAAEMAGFQKIVRQNIEVSVNQVATVDLTLQVGATTQTVEVTGAPPLVQSETSSLGTIETQRRIVDLPLNGRNFIQLAYLGPGANSGAAGTNASGGVFENERANEALSVNGLSVSSNNYLLNGIDNNEFGLGAVVVLPPPDALQEFRVEENSMSAEFGRGGAAVNVVLKSGANSIHGGAYEFLRNDKLDARNFFDDSRPDFRQNQFGFFLGGPIKKNRTFIFGDYQGLRVRQGLTFLTTVPTDKMRAGDFSELGTPIFDPQTTDPATGARQLINPADPTTIPGGRINPVGQAILNLYPSPSRAGIFNNFVINPKRQNDQNSFDIRVDHQIRQGDQLFGHYSFSKVNSLRPGPLGILGGSECCPSNSKNKAHHAGLGWTHTISPTLLNDLRSGYIRFTVVGLPLNFGQDLGTELGIPNANRGDPTSSGLPFFSVSGIQSLGDSLWTPEFVVENIYQIADTLSWVKGKHSLKFGIDFRRQQRNFFQTTAPKGWFDFSGLYTQDLASGTGGNGVADLLLGVPSFVEQDTLKGEYPSRYWDLAGFVQDDFHVTPNLTLNLGLRYEVTSPANGRIGSFDLQKGIVVVAEGPNAVPHAGVKFDKNNWGPRVGLAWTPFGHKRTVVRGAFGTFYATQGNIFDDLGLNPPFLSVNSQVFNPVNVPPPTQLISSGFPATVTFPDPNSPAGTVRTNGPKRVIPYIMEWNFTLQHELAENWVVQAAYVGTRGVRLWNHESSNLNQPPSPLDSNFSVGNFGRPFFNQLPDLDVILPLNFPQLSMIYHAFQAKLEKRFSNGMNLLASYTLAKNLGTADGNVGTVSLQNAFDIAAEKGAVPPDFRHRFVLSYLYELPFGHGKRYLNSVGRAADAVLGGWQVSGITLARSGEAFTAGLSFDPTNTGTFSPRPDRIANPSDFSFDGPTQAALGCTPGKQTLDCFYNQAAFTVSPLAPGQSFAHRFGNSGRSNLRGPSQVNFDFSLLKSFSITERHQVQFRAEFFNVFNHPQFALPDRTVDVPGGASISSTLPDNQREVQLALKWTF